VRQPCRTSYPRFDMHRSASIAIVAGGYGGKLARAPARSSARGLPLP
jgi:hypothetical protein